MSTNFFDGSEAVLLGGSANFSSRITVEYALLGLSMAQAGLYAGLNDAFATAYALAQDPATRSRATIATKNTAKEALIAEARKLARIIQAHPGVTDTQRIELGLTVRQTEPSPIDPPAQPPTVVVQSVRGRTVEARLIDAENPTRRGKPAGAAGASLFRHVGETAPQTLADWTFVGNTGQTQCEIEFGPEVAPGARVWICAFWFSPSKQNGPASTPAGAYLSGGAVSQAA